MLRIDEIKSPIKCVSVVDNNYKAAEQTAYLAMEKGADAVEIRADFWETPDSATDLVEILDFPTIFTCMPEVVGGKYKGYEDVRLKILRKAAVSSTVSLEHPIIPYEVRKEIRKHSEVISTYHKQDVLRVDDGIQIARKMEKEADIVKIVSKPKSRKELLEWFKLTGWMKENIKKPYISLAMGDHGVVSRYATFALGGILSFCAIDEKRRSAPGQPTLEEMKYVLERMYPKK